MAKPTLEQALDQLDQSVAAVRTAIADLAHGGGADAAGDAAHALSGGAIDPFVFRFAIFVLAIFAAIAACTSLVRVRQPAQAPGGL